MGGPDRTEFSPRPYQYPTLGPDPHLPSLFESSRSEEWGWPDATEQETAEIQARHAFSFAIPYSVTTAPFFQTSGNNGPAWLGFWVRNQMLWKLVWITWQKKQGALRDLGRQEVYFTVVGSEEIILQRSEPRASPAGTIYNLFECSKRGRKENLEGESWGRDWNSLISPVGHLITDFSLSLALYFILSLVFNSHDSNSCLLHVVLSLCQALLSELFLY